MRNIETGRTAEIGFLKYAARKLTVALVSPVARSETIDDNNSLGKAKEGLRAGKGLLVIINHFSDKEPEQIIDKIFCQSTTDSKKIIVPIAYHKDKPVYHKMGKIIDVDLKPIVTKSTLEKEEYKNLKLNEGAVEFKNSSVELLREGGIVVLAPQGSRMPYLDKPHATVGTFMLEAKRKGLDDYSFLFIASGIKGITDYSKKGIDGFNLNKKYTLNIGSYMTSKEILKKAEGDFRNVDKIIYEELNKIVPYPQRQTL